jgi:hypothetical protein
LYYHLSNVHIKTKQENHDAHHQIPVTTPNAVDLQNDDLADVEDGMWRQENSHHDDIVIDLGVASEGNKERQV